MDNLEDKYGPFVNFGDTEESAAGRMNRYKTILAAMNERVPVTILTTGDFRGVTMVRREEILCAFVTDDAYKYQEYNLTAVFYPPYNTWFIYDEDDKGLFGYLGGFNCPVVFFNDETFEKVLSMSAFERAMYFNAVLVGDKNE